MTHKRPVISKSKFISGIQCPKKLYFEIFRKDLKPELTEEKKRLFASGHRVGQLAWEVFPGGEDASMVEYNIERSLRLTHGWLEKGESTIYEAAFSADDVLAFLDILHHEDGQRLAIEVKSSTSVKDYHYNDAALQYWVMNRSGYRPDHFILMHINNEYVKDGEIEPQKLFTQVDITNAVLDLQPWVEENLGSLREMLANGLEPEQDIGPHCNTPFECDFKHFCWKHVPEYSVFELSNANGKDWELYDSGIIKLADIPDHFKLNPKQQIQVRTVRERKGYTDTKEIKQFLTTWNYPLHFFDFETIGGAIPLLDGTKPFEQIPFQYSLHKVSLEGEEPEHFEFLADPGRFKVPSDDPRSDLIREMKAHFEGNGSIVAYNARFEKNVIERLASAFPEEKDFLMSLNDRFVDLWDVYRKYWCYTPEMRGSASIKAVLPAIVPDFSYDELQVHDGNEASAIFSSMIDKTFEGDMRSARKDLLAYCQLDTLAMVMLHKELLKI